MLYEVNIPKERAFHLKKVLPDLRFWGYGAQVFSFSDDHREGDELTIKQSRSGFDIGSPIGLANFLKEAGIFTAGRAENLSKKTFVSYELLFHQAAVIAVRGSTSQPEEEEDRFVLALLKEDFLDRVIRAEELGYERVLRVTLAAIEKKFHEPTFMALSKAQKEYYTKLTAPFRKEQFKNLMYTGDLETDCVSVLSCF